mmetsp:Transcript_108717/g.307289  ORF Transcript_108717/g.307289 Transcript_108717/m.307289 type:complete len:264 (+) Transcript_108717:2-793(+)
MHFATFATLGFESVSKELCDEAKGIGIFSQVHCYSDIPEEAMSGRFNMILSRPGVDKEWLYRPALVQYILRRIPMGDTLLFAEAGVELSRNLSKWNELIAVFNAGNPGVLAFQRKSGREYENTKADVFREMGVWMGDVEVESYQVSASYFVVRNTRHTHLFLNNWGNLMMKTNLLTDKASHAPNHKDFVAHDHDASLWSMLVKANRRDSSCRPLYRVKDLVLRIQPYAGCDDLRTVEWMPLIAHCTRHRKGLKDKLLKMKPSS